MSDDRPAERPTQKLSQEEIQKGLMDKLLSTFNDGFSKINLRFDHLQANVDTLIDDGKQYNTRLTTIEVRFDESERRMLTHSLRAKQSSEVDLKTEAALAAEIVSRQDLAKEVLAIKAETAAQTATLDRQTKLLTEAAKWAKDPRVLVFLFALYEFAKSWLERHT